MPGRVEGKVAIVTGGASGIGLATSLLLAREGASVIVADINEAGGAAAVDQIEAQGGRAAFVRADVVDPSDVQNMVNEAVARFGGLHILHNNAFWTVFNRPVTEATDDEWTRTIDICLRGVFNGCRAGIPAMIESGGGSIINMSSVAGTKSSPNVAAYSAAKGGVAALTRSIAFDYGTKGIRANAIAPGTIDTPAISSVLADPATRDYLVSKVLVGRIGKPEDIANAVLYLASDESSFVTGHVLVVDGGRTIA